MYANLSAPDCNMLAGDLHAKRGKRRPPHLACTGNNQWATWATPHHICFIIIPYFYIGTDIISSLSSSSLPQLVILFIMNFSTKAVLSALSMFGGTAYVAAENHPVPNDAICLTQGKIHFSTTTTMATMMMMMMMMMMNYFIHHLYQANITLVRRDNSSLSSHIEMSLTPLSSLIPATIH